MEEEVVVDMEAEVVVAAGPLEVEAAAVVGNQLAVGPKRITVPRWTTNKNLKKK